MDTIEFLRQQSELAMNDDRRIEGVAFARAAVEVDDLRAEREAAVALLTNRDPISYGAAPEASEEKYGYYLDGDYAGPTLEDVVEKAAGKARGE